MDPGRGHDWGLLHSTFNNRLHDDNEEAHAFGVDDVEQIIPASVQINTLLDDRRQSAHYEISLPIIICLQIGWSQNRYAAISFI